MVEELILKARSYRRFDENKRIPHELLVKMVDYARRTASGSNKQVLRYFIADDMEINKKVSECIGWAGYLTEWNGPVDGEKPAAYIVLLTENDANSAYDEGIAAQSIMLMAAENNIGGCFLLNVKREEMRKLLNIPEKYRIKLVIALGYPAEKVVIDDISEGEDIKYYRDGNDCHHVPKLGLKDVLINA